MTHRDLPRGPSGRRNGRRRCGPIGKAFRRPPTGRGGDRNGGLPRLSDGVARASRCAASPRPALLAEILGKPSLWVIITAPWYYPR
jgi:hypothetical protein